MGLVPKNHRKWSVILIVMIIMIISSFLVLLTIRYFQHTLNTFASLTNYYKAYYLARWSMDILLTEQSYRGRGYQIQTDWLNKVLQCENCGVTWSVISRFPRIDMSVQPTDNQCSFESSIMLSGGQSAIFPLFADEWSDTFTFSQQATKYIALWQTLNDIMLYIYPENKDTFFWKIFLYDASTIVSPFWTREKVGSFWRVSWSENFWQIAVWTIPIWLSEVFESQFTTHRAFATTSPLFQWTPNKSSYYIIITNPKTVEGAQTPATPFSICFSQKNHPEGIVPMIWLNTILRADAHVVDSYVTLETIKTNRFPSFLVQ